MRFSLTSTLAIAMAGSTAIATALPSLTCLKIPSIVQAVDPTQIVNIWQNEMCSQGCDIRVSNYQSQIRGFAASFFQDECTTMGIPELAPHYLSIIDAIFEKGMQKCVPVNYLDADMCGSDFPLAETMECLKGNVLGLIWEISGSIWPMLSSNCQAQYNYFASENLCSNVLPSCAKKFAAEHCKAV